jgi:hypothetical protein
VDFWVLNAFGSPSAVKKRYGVTPRMQDRLAASLVCFLFTATNIADRGRWGFVFPTP